MQPQLNEESQRVIKYLIKASPYGEHQEVLRDLERLVPINTDDESFQEHFREHNEEHLALVLISPPKEFLLVTAASRHNDGYVDQAKQTFYRVDHKNQRVVHAEPLDCGLAAGDLDFVQQLRKDLDGYLAKYFREQSAAQGTAHQNVVFLDVRDHTIHIGYTSKNLNLSNLYGGQWIGIWTLQGEHLKGTVSIHAHFFESGNVQLHQSKNFEFVVSTERNASTSAAIVQAFEKAESQLQTKLDDLYENDMPNRFFKALRRITPVTRVKMNWNMAAYGMKQNLESAANIVASSK